MHPVINPALAMLGVVGLFAWMAIRPASTAPARVFLLIVGVMLFGPLSVAVMDFEAAAVPLKFDPFLQSIDNAIGITAFSVARRLSARDRDLLFLVYETLGYWMILWYGLNLAWRRGRPRQLLVSYVAAYALAPLFYLIVPACGPRHAFGAEFPWGSPGVNPSLMALTLWPNAIPSLHFATAILFVYFAPSNRVMRCFAWAYLASTALATLAFEHYVIDLAVAVPYSFFVIRLGEQRFRAASRELAVVLLWLISIRFATPLLLRVPMLLRLAVGATVFAPWVNTTGVRSALSRFTVAARFRSVPGASFWRTESESGKPVL